MEPGIGTYVNTRSLSHKSLSSRFNSWYQKAKDSAVGTSFDEHVMGGMMPQLQIVYGLKLSDDQHINS